MNELSFADTKAQNMLIKAELINYLQTVTSNLVVLDEDTARKALSCSMQAKKMKNTIEESRKQIVRPHIDFQKAVMKLSKDLSDKIECIEQSLENQISTWMLDEKLHPFGAIDELEVEDGKMSIKTKWEFQITESTIIPTEYLKPDEDAIKKAIINGIRNIPGINIYNYKSSQMRIKN